MKFFFKSFLIISLLGFLSLNPYLAHAQLVDESTSSTSRSLGGLVPCGNDKDAEGNIINPCDFDYFLFMINKIINFILTVLAIPLAAVAFAYAGFLLLFSGGQASQRQKAKTIFWNTAIGLIIIAACWLIISTILSVLGYDGAWIGF
jgi:hypothetical protein